jgi:HPt (histidine-containing phosphotransfer) domain-containing protein
MDDYISKPVQPATLIATLENSSRAKPRDRLQPDTASDLSRGEKVGNEERGKNPNTPTPQYPNAGLGAELAPSEAEGPGERSTAPPAPSVVNLAAVLDAINGDADLLNKLILAFLTDTPERIAALRRAVEQNDALAASREAHTIKGVSATFGAVQLRGTAYRIEQYATQGTLAAAKAAIPTLEAEWSRVEQALRTQIWSAQAMLAP